MKSTLFDKQHMLEDSFAWNDLLRPFKLRLCLSLLVKCLFPQAANI